MDPLRAVWGAQRSEKSRRPEPSNALERLAAGTTTSVRFIVRTNVEPSLIVSGMEGLPLVGDDHRKAPKRVILRFARVESVFQIWICSVAASPLCPLGILKSREVRNVRFLLILVLALSSVCYASGSQGQGAADRPKIQLEHPVNPHLDTPRNCRALEQQDGSVLMTCECEDCGQPDSHDGLDPVPWTCQSREGGLYCSYQIDTQTSGERKHSHI